jgi:hypothetical protein
METDQRPGRLQYALVAVVGIVLIGGLWLAMVFYARRLAAVHQGLATNYGVVSVAAQNNTPLNNFQIDRTASPRNQQLQASYRALFFYHEQLAEKYRRAAWRPWLLFTRDPPEPAAP